MPVRPPFTGIHEQFPLSGGGIPHEGGGRLPPFGEDIFQRVVDINFGGGDGGAVFTGGDTCCFVRSVRIPTLTLDQPWTFLGAPVFTTHGACDGGACGVVDGKPVFLLSGGNQLGGAVAYSNDGFNWVQTYGATTGNEYSGLPYMLYLIWDAAERKFYGLSRGIVNQYVGRAIWSSPDGIVWTLVAQVPFEDQAQAFWEHSQNPYGLQDGIVGYNPNSDKWIHPDDIPTDIPGTMQAFFECVAYAGGIWQAYGMTRFVDNPAIESAYVGSIFMSSLDDGETWYQVGVGDFADNNNDFRITALLGLDIEFFPEEPEIPEPYLGST